MHFPDLRIFPDTLSLTLSLDATDAFVALLVAARRVAFVAIERRYCFTRATLSVEAPAHDYFVHVATRNELRLTSIDVSGIARAILVDSDNAVGAAHDAETMVLYRVESGEFHSIVALFLFVVVVLCTSNWLNAMI